MKTFHKDPDAVLDYQIDWSDWLDTDTIADSTWTAPDDGITMDSDEASTTATVVWLSGGTAGDIYTLTNHITTDGGREDDRSIQIVMTNK